MLSSSKIEFEINFINGRMIILFSCCCFFFLFLFKFLYPDKKIYFLTQPHCNNRRKIVTNLWHNLYETNFNKKIQTQRSHRIDFIVENFL